MVGFGTGADGYDIPDFVCDIYFEGQMSRILICIYFDQRGSDNGAPINRNEDTC